ncbi:MAG: motility associated factor glycosyltransferase family protein [Simkania sp.]|nr:motility associated factor glycosyltransferase family protein [Simkania sp.]
MLVERYPELHFRLMWEKVEYPFEQCGENAVRHINQVERSLHAEDGLKAELSRFSKELCLNDVEVFYLYGLGLGHHITLFQEWLQSTPKRRLVVLEDDLAVIDACYRFGRSEVFSHPQIYLRFVPHGRAWHNVLLECAKDFPGTHFSMKALESYAKDKKKQRLSKLKLKLFRFSGLVHTYFTEAIHAHLIHRNLLCNLQHLTRSFDARGLKDTFKGTPAVICGAGPSLKGCISTLQTLQDRALIIAGGSTITALGNAGVMPHLALAIDPNEEELHRLQASIVQETPFIYGQRLHSKVFDTFNAPLGYAPTKTGGSAEDWIHGKLHLGEETIGGELGPEALSITTLGLSIAYAMGCDPIIIAGVDLGYVGLERYAPGVMVQQPIEPQGYDTPREQLETIIKRKDGKGRALYTLVKWVMEAGVFSKFAAKHKKVKFFRCGDQGLPMKGIPSMPIEQIAEQYCTKTTDLLGRLHQVVQAAVLLSITQQEIADLKEELQESLKRMVGICSDMLEEIQRVESQEHLSMFPTGKMMALSMAFEEEPAFPCLFEAVGFAFAERYRKQNNLTEDSIELAKQTWNHMSIVVQYYLSEPEFWKSPL